MHFINKYECIDSNTSECIEENECLLNEYIKNRIRMKCVCVFVCVKCMCKTVHKRSLKNNFIPVGTNIYSCVCVCVLGDSLNAMEEYLIRFSFR